MTLNTSIGFPGITEFQVTALSSDHVSWGDGSYSDQSPFKHIYDKQGRYTIQVMSCSALDSEEVVVRNPLVPGLEIMTDPVSSNPGCGATFVLSVSSLIAEPTIHFYASGSNSDPYQSPQNFWSHLKPQWRFEKDGDAIAAVTLSADPVYIDDHIIGYTTDYSFQYVDDMPGTPILFATLETSYGTNSRVFAGIPHTINTIAPERLEITGDGLNPISRIQYAGVKIPYVISVAGGCNTIMHYASGTVSDARIYGKCYGVNPDSPDDIVGVEIALVDANCFSTGGYLITALTIPADSLPEITHTSTVDPCDYETVERETTRRFVFDAYLYAEAIVTVGGQNYTLSGVSNTFNIYPYAEFYQFRRQNESTNLSETIRDYSFTEAMRNSPTLWNYMDALFGNETPDTLGVRATFGIGNFTTNHHDIDRCQIRALYDIARMLDVPVDDYNLDMPHEVERVMDLVSIAQEKVVGRRCVCNGNFADCSNCCGANQCKLCGFDKRTNVGTQLTLSDTVTAGTPILIKERDSKVYEIYNVVPHGGEDIIPVRDLSAGVLEGVDVTGLCFYRWDQSPQLNPVESEIDYHSQYTTISRQLTSVEDWYGEDGVIEEMLTYILVKGLDLDDV